LLKECLVAWAVMNDWRSPGDVARLSAADDLSELHAVRAVHQHLQHRDARSHRT